MTELRCPNKRPFYDGSVALMKGSKRGAAQSIGRQPALTPGPSPKGRGDEKTPSPPAPLPQAGEGSFAHSRLLFQRARGVVLTPGLSPKGRGEFCWKPQRRHWRSQWHTAIDRGMSKKALAKPVAHSYASLCSFGARVSA